MILNNKTYMIGLLIAAFCCGGFAQTSSGEADTGLLVIVHGSPSPN